MKKLFLIRHAKSSWKFDVEDHERPLNDRGIRDAGLIGEKLCESLSDIDKIVSSGALRAQTTAAIITEKLSAKPLSYDLENRLYDFSGEQVLQYIKSTDASINTLMLFGHNHAFTRLVNTLGDTMIENVPTAGVVGIQFEISDWKQLNVGKTFLTLFPKSLR